MEMKEFKKIAHQIKINGSERGYGFAAATSTQRSRVMEYLHEKSEEFQALTEILSRSETDIIVEYRYGNPACVYLPFGDRIEKLDGRATYSEAEYKKEIEDLYLKLEANAKSIRENKAKLRDVGIDPNLQDIDDEVDS